MSSCSRPVKWELGAWDKEIGWLRGGWASTTTSHNLELPHLPGCSEQPPSRVGSHRSCSRSRPCHPHLPRRLCGPLSGPECASRFPAQFPSAHLELNLL